MNAIKPLALLSQEISLPPDVRLKSFNSDDQFVKAEFISKNSTELDNLEDALRSSSLYKKNIIRKNSKIILTMEMKSL